MNLDAARAQCGGRPSNPMKLAPITRRAARPVAAAMMARQSASVRKV